MKKKNIVFYTDCPLVGGSENTIINILSNKLLYDKYNVKFIFRYSKEYDQNIKKYDLKADIEYIKLISFDNWIIKLNYSNPIDVIKRIIIKFLQILTLSNIINSILLYNKIKKCKPDLIHINNGGFPGANSCNIVGVFSKIISKNTIYTINNIPSLSRYNVFHKFYLYVFRENIDYFTTASRYSKNKIIEIFKINNVLNIPNCLMNNSKEINEKNQISKYIKNKNYKIFTTAGILTKRKGFIELIDCFNLYGKKDFYLFIFGEGELEEQIRKKIIKYNLSDNIFLMGFTSNLIEEVKKSHYFVLNSLYNEDMPYVLIEALSLSKPIISTNLAGANEIIFHQKNGFVSKPYDYIKLKENIEKAITLSQDKYISFKKYSEKIYKNKFNNEKIINKYMNLYSELLND